MKFRSLACLLFGCAVVLVGGSSSSFSQTPQDPENPDSTAPGRVFSRGVYPSRVPEVETTKDPDVPKEPDDPKKPAQETSPEPKPQLTEGFPPPPTEPSAVAVGLFRPEDQLVAQRAWSYLTSNRNAETGLYVAVLHYQGGTLWDIGSGIAGLVAAEQLGLIRPEQFNADMTLMLDSLAKMPLYNEELPNREYDLRTLQMLGRDSLLSHGGTGWSALDIGRSLLWLRIVTNWYPEFAPKTEEIVQQWDLSRLAKGEQANGVAVDNSQETLRQEGRLGYEQYAARGFRLWNAPLIKAEDYAETEQLQLYGIDLRRDTRAPAFLTAEPFLLAAMEIGKVDPEFDRLSEAVFQVQKRRWQETGRLTAISEDSVAVEPWFLYNSIFHNTAAWACVSPSGKVFDNLKTVSTKAAFAYAALYDDDYAQKLEQAVRGLYGAQGYYGGQYETGGINDSLNLNTNAVILEAMLFRKRNGEPFLALAKEVR